MGVVGKALKKKKHPAMIQELQLAPLIGINLFKKKCNS